jgi:hypothetical protein
MMGGDISCFVSIFRIPADMRIFRKPAVVLLVFMLLSAFSVSSKAAVQEAVGINFFDIARADAGSPTCWDGESYAWVGGSTTVTNCTGGNGGVIPVTIVDGIGSLNFTTTRPSGGWGNIQFKIDGGHSVNFLRYGSSPYMYLRLKWGAIASGAALNIALYDSHSIWNSYDIYNNRPSTYIDNSAVVALSSYVTPSTTVWQDVYIPMADFFANNPNLDLTKISILEFQVAGNYSSTNTMYLQKIKIVPDTNFANGYSDMVKVNMIGYLPDQKKMAIVSYEAGTVTAPTYFQVLDANTGNVVYQSNLTLDTPYSSSWDKSGDTVYHADLTSFTTPGRYVIYCPELDQVSPAFNIGKKVFDKVFRDGLRFYYYGRSAVEINEPYAEGHARPSIYSYNIRSPYDYDDDDPNKMYDYDPNNKRITTRDVAGGWFDAGDLHLDIHNNVGTMWLLLQTYKQFKNKLGPDTLNLPESDSQTNDLVWLIKWELDWFKKMQNTDGSVHFIVINEGDITYQKVSDVSTSAAAVLAGIFAKASTLFADVPGMESYSADLLTRAQLSWTWLMAHTTTYNPKDSSGNLWSYGNWTNDTSHRVFAASELYDATGDTTYRTYFESRVSNSNPLSLPGANFSGYITQIGSIYPPAPAYIDYIDTARPVDESKRTVLKNLFINEAAKLNTDLIRTTYNIPTINSNDLFWGSSGLLCSNAYILLRAYEWTGTTAYRDAAIDVIDWICGRNPVSRIFVTGDYSDYLHGTDIYSFFWFDYIGTVPGYLCGNINNNYASTSRTFPNANIKYKDKYYLNVQNAAALEPCIHWQAEMCYLLGYAAYDLKWPYTVDSAYIGQFAQAWLSSTGGSNWNPNFDLAVPADGVIDFLDFAVIASHWLEVN